MEELEIVQQKILIIDADSIIYKIAWVNQETEDWDIVKNAVDNYLKEIFKNTEGTHFVLCLTVGRCFRYEAAKTKPYKGNRKDVKKPKYFDRIKEYFITHYKAFYSIDKYEADDLIFILKSQYEEKYPEAEVILCINDKDCLQYPGEYYDYHKSVLISLGEKEANYNKLTQLLIGDSTDNINLIEGLGKKTAERILEKNEHDLVTIFVQFYGAFNSDDEAVHKFYEAWKLIHLVQEDNTIEAPSLLEVKND